MEMKVSAKHKTLWKKNSTSEPLSVTGVEDDPLKKFTIPKIRRKVGKVYLSPCLTNTREYSFIHDTLNQCRLDGKCDLQSSWQFGDTKLVHNEQLEKNFTSKRSEMRENGRHGRETEEHFCFLALPQGDVAEIYQNGLSTTASTLKILGNPLFGIYLFRHVDVALNYAHSRSINVESVLIFKVLFGKVKKVHLSVDKNKVSLDPSPNFDCHMSRNAPSLRHTVELQAYNSAVYFYEYNVLSKPVDKPRQCLPYAIITIKFIGQKVDNGHLMTSLRFLSTGFPKSAERTCSLNNCTVAKRIGKGKDAAVIFEHFRKPVDPHVQENCSCNILNSKTDCSTSDISNSYENVQHGNVSVLDTSSGQVKHDLTECRDTSQVQAYDSSLSFIPSDTRESGDGGDHLLSLIQLKNILSGLSTAFPLHNNTGSSTVITSRVIKDPRLTRREESMDKHHNITGLNEILPFEKSLNSVNSEINLPVPTNSATSSEAMPSKDIVLTNCLDAACFKIPSDDSQSQAQNIGSMNCDYKTPNKITTAGQVQGQDNCSFPICLSNVVSEVENRKHSEEQAEKSQQRSNIPLLVEQNNEPCNSYELVNTGMKGCNSHISQELQPSNLKPVCKPGHQASTTASFQRKENIHEYVQNIEKLRNFTSLEENFKHVEKQNLWEGMDNCTNETKISTVDNYQEHKEDESLDSFGRDGDQKLISQESEISGSSSATRNKLKYRALELQNNLTPRVESLSQKHPQDCLEKDNIHTCFSISRKLMELKLEKNQNGFSIITDAFQKAKDIPQAKEVPLSTVTSSHDIKTAHDDSNCSIAREHTCVHRKNENDLVSLENIQTDCEETSQIDDKNEDHILFCNAKLNDDIYLDVYLKQQRTNKDNQNVTKEEDIASPVENNIENTCGDEKQGFHTNKNLLEIEDTTTGVKQKDTQTTTMSVEHLASALPQISGSLLHVTPDVATQRDGTVVPALGTNHDNHQGYEFKETYSSESPYLGLVIKHRVSDCEMERDKNRFHSSFHQSISDKSVLQNFSLDSEIEIESEQCNDTFLFQQDTQSHGNTLYEEFGASYEALKSRIDWEGLFGSNIGEEEVLNSTTRREQSDQHYSDYSSTQENKAEPFNPILLPDLQVRITNTLMPGFNSTVESLAPKDKFCERITEFTKPEICDEKGDVLGFEIYSQCSGENSDYPCEDEVGNIRQESGLESKSETSLSFDLSHNTHMNHIPEGQNSGPLLTEPSNVIAVNNESRCSLTKSKTDYNETRSKKDTESRITKRKSYAPFVDQNIPHHELCEKKRWLTSKDTSECFSSLFRGQIKAFSQSEKHIRRVLDVLNSEIPLCNSKCLSKNLRALLYLKKSHRRDFLEFITKLGETRKSPLPKLFAIICSNFWESCNFQGYSSLSERQHSTKYFFSERKQDKLEKRALGFEGNKSLTHVSKYQSHKTSGDRITKCFSKKNVANNVSRNHITIHMREFGDQERPESQLILCSTSQSSSHSAYNSSHIGSPRPEVQTFSGKTGCLLSPDCPEGKQTEKENQSDVKSLSNNKYEKPENHLAHNNKDALKENAEANEVINKTNSVSLHCIKENNVSLNTDKSHNMTRIASTKMNKPDNLILFGYERNPEVKFLEKWTSTENSKPGPITGNICMDPSNQTLITSKKCSSIPQLLSTAPVTDSGGESSKPYLDKQRIFAVNSFATSTNVPHCQQECGGKELRKSQQCSPSNCVHIDRNSQSGLVPVTEKESKSYGENTTERLFYSDSSPLLKDDIKGSSKRYISKKDIPDRKTWKVNQTERAKDSFHTKSVTAVPAAKNEWTNRKMKILEESSSSEKTIRNNLIESHLSIKNTKEAISLNNTVSNQLNKGEKGGGVQVSPGSQSASTLHSETACNSKPDILGMNPTPALHAHSETSKVITPQSKPTSYVNKLEEEHCSANHAGLTVKLAQILRRADEASSLQSLQEETKVCQSILPFFVEAFERMQECSFEQILISRELLVEKNLWNNWKHKLKPCAVDSLVELQMMMETIQFIENKKRLLGGEQTFRSLLWYDETLYSELLGKPRGFQQQSNFYPGFQGRLKYNAFCEFQDYQDQLIELLENTKRETDSYYAFLKCKRQINECEAILRHYSDCFDFSLSVPFTCGVNFGDSLGDLETLRQSTLKLISMYSDSPKFDSRSGKEDHLWIIVEMIASKVNFMKNNEAVSIHVSLYGLEHIFFDAAKSLVWKERRQSFNKKYSGQKNKETLLKMNQYSFSRLQKIYDTLSKDLSSEQISNIVPEENIGMASRKLNDLINKEPINIENCRFNSTLLSLPDICCINEILAQAEFADCTKLQELTLRCTDHLEILKKYFQMLQEDNIDNIFITEENVLDVVKNHHHEAVILKPEATETYVEIAMLLETVHYLKNSMAKKLDKQRFRSMLWFDLSLLPELVHCQEKMASFSFLEGNSIDCLWEVIETAISELKKDLDIIYKYNEAVNSSYALHLFSRELEELSEIKKLLKDSKYSISTYINFVPCIASINYGSTVTELEYNYCHFSTLLRNIMAAPQKDLGKMAHIVKVMKTIEHMKIICAKNAELTISFILCQMLYNRTKSFELKRKGKIDVLLKPRKPISKSSTCIKVPSISECTMKNVSNSKKRPISADEHEDSQEQEKNTAVSSCKKQKVNMKDVTKINREKATFKHPRTTRFHPESESEIEPSSSDNQKGNHGSPKKAEMQRPLPRSSLPLKNLKDTSMFQSGEKIDVTDISSDTAEDFTGQQENLNSMKKRDKNFSVADKKDCSPFAISDQKSIDGSFSKDHKTPSQKFLNSPDLSGIKPGTDASLQPNASVPSKSIFCFVRDTQANLEMKDTVFELQGNELLNSPIKNSTGPNSPKPVLTQNRVPVLQINETQPEKPESKKQCMKATLSPSSVPVETSENITLNVNQTAEYSFSKQRNNEGSKALTQKAATSRNELPQSACTPVYNTSEQSLGTVYPASGWGVYYYNSSSGDSVTQTYQGIMSTEAQRPSEMLTVVPSTAQNAHSNLLYSQYFGYFAGGPQAYYLMPTNGHFPSQMPVSYVAQQPAFSQYVSYQPLPQAAYPCPPQAGARPQVPWTYVSWQYQEPFQPRH